MVKKLTIPKPPPPPPIKRPPPPPFQRPVLRTIDSNAAIMMSPKIIIPPLDIRGKSIALMGVNGSGKSTSSRRMMEEHIRLGLPFTVADIENEYPMLKELGEVVIAGPKANMGKINVDVTLTNTGQFHEMGQRAYLEKLTVVLLLGDLDDDTRKAYLKAYLDGVFEASTPDNKRYYRIFLEECQEYIPQVGGDKKDSLRLTILRFGKRGRKRHLSLALISQRPANVDKDVLTQCHGFLLHFVTYPTDIEVYEKALGIPKAAEKMRSMQPGDVIYQFGRVNIEDRVTRPQTVSPWEHQGDIDVTKFRQVETTAIQQKINQDQNESGMSVVPTAYLNSLEKKIPKLEKENVELLELNEGLEKRILDLQNRVSVTTDDVPLDAALAKIEELQGKLETALKVASPIHQLAEIIREQIAAV